MSTEEKYARELMNDVYQDTKSMSKGKNQTQLKPINHTMYNSTSAHRIPMRVNEDIDQAANPYRTLDKFDKIKNQFA